MPTFLQVLTQSKLLRPTHPISDIEILLAFVTQTSRAHIHAWPDKELTAEQANVFNVLLQRALQGEPIAYLTGVKEFWSQPLRVTPDTLIPRPETELLVDIILQRYAQEPALSVLDLGTGSGAIAIALASEKPHWQITATDVSQAALQIAKQNAAHLQLTSIQFQASNWFEEVDQKFMLIVSNPPYIAEDDSACEAQVRRFEPRLALFSDAAGYRAFETIIHDSPSFLEKNGFLLLEHGSAQSEKVRAMLASNGFEQVQSYWDLGGHARASSGILRTR